MNEGSTLLVVNVAHDASHQCLSKNKQLNHWLAYVWNVMGISAVLWEMQHHRSHHNHTGTPHRDVDVDENFGYGITPLTATAAISGTSTCMHLFFICCLGCSWFL